MDVTDAESLRSPEHENGKLKLLLAAAMHSNAALKDLLPINGESHCEGKRQPSFHLYVLNEQVDPFVNGLLRSRALTFLTLH